MGEEYCWSVKVLDLDRGVVQERIRTLLGPFIVPFEVELPEEDFDFEQEEYFERSNSAELDSCEPEPKDVVLNVETICAIVFVPPCYHLLMRFTISSHSTIVRIFTDRFQLLSYMDVFFLSWSHDTELLQSECAGISGETTGATADAEVRQGPANMT